MRAKAVEIFGQKKQKGKTERCLLETKSRCVSSVFLFSQMWRCASTANNREISYHFFSCPNQEENKKACPPVMKEFLRMLTWRKPTPLGVKGWKSESA